MGFISNPADPGAALTVAETEVFNGTSPIAWTDLDLSAIVGANRALVLLKVGNPATTIYGTALRRNGDVDESYNASSHGASKASFGGVSLFMHAVMATDAAGIIEWRAGAAVAGVTIDVVAYIK